MLLLPQTTFFFKFLKITKLPLSMECNITCAPSSCGSIWTSLFLSWAGFGGSLMVAAGLWRSQGSEEPSCWSNGGNVIPNGSHQWPSTGPGPVGRLSWLKTASEKDLQRVSYATLLWWDPFATACFSIYFSHRWDEPIFHWPPGFFSLRTVIKKYVASQLKTEFYLKIFKLTLV